MKKTLPLLAILFAAFAPLGLLAQITISNSIIPTDGDSAILKNITDVSQIDLGIAGANQSWDFSLLTTTNERVVRYRAASSGSASAEFPTADIVEIISEMGANLENYYSTADDKWSILGFQGADPVGLGLNVLVKYQNPLIEFEAPFDYSDNQDDLGSTRIAQAWDDLPSELTGMINPPITPDSIAVVTEFQNDIEIDAWGTVEMPEGQIEVLRMKVTQKRESEILAITPFITLPITGLIEGLGLGFQPSDTIIRYEYYTNGHPGPIARFIENDGEITVGTLASVDGLVSSTSAINRLANTKPSVKVHPNPVVSQAMFTFKDLQVGRQYDLRVTNLLGKTVWQTRINNSNTRKYDADLSFLPVGTYVYSLTESTGKIVTAKRMVLLKP